MILDLDAGLVDAGTEAAVFAGEGTGKRIPPFVWNGGGAPNYGAARKM
ncbi:MAG: hypothetical protein Q7S96_02155 [bacterium]|nr:hypothetical protein [bacterium]